MQYPAVPWVQVVLEVLESNVKRGSAVYEKDHVSNAERDCAWRTCRTCSSLLTLVTVGMGLSAVLQVGV